jgi:hypothetical protein
MHFEAALLQTKNIKFVVVVVKPHVLNSSVKMNITRLALSIYFKTMPIVLASSDMRGPIYHGRIDIIRSLVRISPLRIPWKVYNVK